MDIEKISNNKISRKIIETAKDISENDRRELLTIFDCTDSVEEDNQDGIITEEEAVAAFLDMVKESLSKSFDKIVEILKIDKTNVESIARISDGAGTPQEGAEWNNVGKELLRTDNKYLGNYFPSNLHLEVFNKIIEKIDNGDGLVQENEYILARRLLNIANNLVEDSQRTLDETQISLKGLNLLLQKIEDGTFDINRLKEDIKKETSVEYKYPQAEDITGVFDIEPQSEYDVKIFKTNTTTKYDGVGDGKSKLEYDTYVISFIEPNTGITENLDIHIDKKIQKEENRKIILTYISESNSNIVNLMLREINDLYVTSEKNNTRKFGGKNSQDGYEKFPKNTMADAFYEEYQESINIYYDGTDFYNIEALAHELGHAKDNNSDTKLKLYKLLENEKVNQDESLLVNDREMYAELFSDFADTQETVSVVLEAKYEDIINQLPEEVNQKLIEEATISILTNQDMTISSILNRADLYEYKEKFGERINDALKGDILYGDAKDNTKKMKKLGKNNPQIAELHIKLMHEIANAYNHPKENVHKQFKTKF